MPDPIDLILLVDKPAGITSFGVVHRVRSRYPKGTKVGHAGTLDPMATGLMILAVGKATKRLDPYIKLPKVYEAEILLGLATDTGDVTGAETARGDASGVTEASALAATVSLAGALELPVPAYSAVKVGGVRLYKKARRGQEFEPPRRVMEVRAAEFRGFAPADPRGPIVAASFDVASGTYVRSLAEELGRRLGVPATLASLRRTRVGEWRVEDAEQLG